MILEKTGKNAEKNGGIKNVRQTYTRHNAKTCYISIPRTTAILHWTAGGLQRLRILRTLSRMFSRHTM